MSIDIQRDGRVALLTINRPEVLNALSTEILEELYSEVTDLARDNSVGAIVLTGAGDKAFIAGADIAELATKTPLEARAYGELGQDIAHRLETMRKPTIAAVNGYALGGGCEMALACDIRLCSENAVFGQPEVNLGIMPGWGGTQRLARTTSLGFAKEIVLTGRMVPAEEAFQRGLVQAIHPQEDLVPKALEMAADDRRQEPRLRRLRQGGDQPRAPRRPRRELRARGRPVRDPLLDRGREGGPAGLHREAPAALHRQVAAAAIVAAWMAAVASSDVP